MGLSPLKGLKRLRKPWSKLTQLPQLDGHRIRERPYDTPYVSQEKQEFDTTNDEVDRLARELNDRGLAERIIRMRTNLYPYGTIPELLCVDWLDSQQIEYIYQAKMFGGYRSGGIVPDFLVRWGGGWLVILINGVYWHNLPGMVLADESDKVRMLGSDYQGFEIRAVVIVWESRLLSERESVMQAAIQGVDLGM